MNVKTAKVCTIDDIGMSITGEDSQPIVEAINEYLSIFAKPVKREGGGNCVMGSYECLNCGEPLGGLLGTFQWGLCHGEGTCTCGWPCRAYHRPKDNEGEELFNGPIQLILQYHPSGVTKRRMT